MEALLLVMTDATILLPVAVFFMVLGLSIAATERQPQIALRLARHTITLPGTLAAGPVPPSGSRSSRQRLQLPAALDRLSSLFRGEKGTAQARLLLNRAGSPMSLETYIRVRRAFTFAVAPLFALLTLVALGRTPLAFGAAAVVLLTAPRLPAIRLKRIGKNRAREMDVVISDVLDLLVVCVEGGQSLSAGLMQVSQRMDNVASGEFSRLLDDLNRGMSRRDAFNALADRCQSEMLGVVCTTVIHADKVGMSLAQTLRTLSDTMRTRRRQAAETRARQAPIKMMPVLVGFMLPTLLALLLGPVALEVMETFK